MSSDAQAGDPHAKPPGQTAKLEWLKLGVIAAASAIAGGAAAALFYRKTLNRLREADAHAREADVGRSEPGSGDEL
jgi:hypothetical protein